VHPLCPTATNLHSNIKAFRRVPPIQGIGNIAGGMDRLLSRWSPSTRKGVGPHEASLLQQQWCHGSVACLQLHPCPPVQGLQKIMAKHAAAGRDRDTDTTRDQQDRTHQTATFTQQFADLFSTGFRATRSTAANTKLALMPRTTLTFNALLYQ
jgi:hypothetical protein